VGLRLMRPLGCSLRPRQPGGKPNLGQRSSAAAARFTMSTISSSKSSTALLSPLEAALAWVQ
jgi:hypothetical protein